MVDQNGAAPATASDDSQRRSFHIEEFKALRDEVAVNISRTISSFQYVLLGSAAIYSFLLGVGDKAGTPVHFPHTAFAILWCIPTVLSIIGLLNYRSSVSYLSAIGRYLGKLEKHIGLAGLGWEQHFSDDKNKSDYDQFLAFTIAWWLITGLNAVAAFYGLQSLPPQS